MERMGILVEKTGRGRGVALTSGGRIVRVHVPRGVEIGDDLPVGTSRVWLTPAVAAAIAGLFLAGSAFVLLSGRGRDEATTIVLRFEPRIRMTADAGTAKSSEEQLVLRYGGTDVEMALAVDREGKVISVQPDDASTRSLVGRPVENAIQETMGRLNAEGTGGVEIRPGYDATGDVSSLADRIRTALPDSRPPITVQVLTDEEPVETETDQE